MTTSRWLWAAAGLLLLSGIGAAVYFASSADEGEGWRFFKSGSPSQGNAEPAGTARGFDAAQEWKFLSQSHASLEGQYGKSIPNGTRLRLQIAGPANTSVELQLAHAPLQEVLSLSCKIGETDAPTTETSFARGFIVHEPAACVFVVETTRTVAHPGGSALRWTAATFMPPQPFTITFRSSSEPLEP